MAASPNDALNKLLAGGLSDAIVRLVYRVLDRSSADWGVGTVTAVAPGGLTGTVAVDTGTGTPITMRCLKSYATPAVADIVRWDRSRAGDFSVTGEFA